MEASSVPMLAASRFLSAPSLLPTPSCSWRNLPCVRSVPQTVEAPEMPKPPRLSPRRSAVAEVKASTDPIAALARFEDVLQAQDCNIINPAPLRGHQTLERSFQDGYTFNIMISALHRGGHRQESKQLVKEFEAENTMYDLELCSHVMVQLGKISTPSLEKFARSFIASGNINLTNDVMKALNRSGWRISQDIFGRAIQQYVPKPDKQQLLLCLLDGMAGQGYSVDSSSRNLLLKSAHMFGQKQLIAEVLSKQQAASRTNSQKKKMISFFGMV